MSKAYKVTKRTVMFDKSNPEDRVQCVTRQLRYADYR